MNVFANIWNHPRTTVTGLLIGVASVGSVLSQQGVTIGKAGTSNYVTNYVTLATGLATVLLGMLAQDPAQSVQPADAKSASQPGQKAAA